MGKQLTVPDALDITDLINNGLGDIELVSGRTIEVSEIPIDKVRAELNLSTMNLGTLAKSTNINMFSYFKAGWLAADPTTKDLYVNAPDGGASEKFELDDFAAYNHNAVGPEIISTSMLAIDNLGYTTVSALVELNDFIPSEIGGLTHMRLYITYGASYYDTQYVAIDTSTPDQVFDIDLQVVSGTRVYTIEVSFSGSSGDTLANFPDTVQTMTATVKQYVPPALPDPMYFELDEYGMNNSTDIALAPYMDLTAQTLNTGTGAATMTFNTYAEELVDSDYELIDTNVRLNGTIDIYYRDKNNVERAFATGITIYLASTSFASGTLIDIDDYSNINIYGKNPVFTAYA